VALLAVAHEHLHPFGGPDVASSRGDYAPRLLADD